MLSYVGPWSYKSLDIWLLLYFFCKCRQGVLLLVAATLPKMVSVWTAAVKHTRAKWSGLTEHSMVCSAHFETTYFYHGLYHQFNLTIKQMLLHVPDSISTIFPLSKKAKVPQRIRVTLSRIILTWTWSCHGWCNTAACALLLRVHGHWCVHCHCRSIVHNVHVGLHMM